MNMSTVCQHTVTRCQTLSCFIPTSDSVILILIRHFDIDIFIIYGCYDLIIEVIDTYIYVPHIFLLQRFL